MAEGETKKVSKKSYVWGHIGVIIYHSLTAIILIASQYSYKVFGIVSKNVVLIVAGILLITSLLAIWPIVKDYHKIEIMD